MEGLGLPFSGLFCPLLLLAHAERELITCRIMGAGQGLEACTAIEKYKAWRSSHPRVLHLYFCSGPTGQAQV